MEKQRIYLKEWRKSSSLTQRQVADRLASMEDELLPRTEASLSRLERGQQPYSQRVLEALAHVYSCEAWELIGRNPFKAGEIIDLTQIQDEKRRAQAKAVFDALLMDTGTDGE